MPVPPIEEQHEIVRRATSMLKAADALLAKVELAAHSVDTSFQAVLAKAFRGDLLARSTQELGQNLKTIN